MGRPGRHLNRESRRELRRRSASAACRTSLNVAAPTAERRHASHAVRRRSQRCLEFHRLSLAPICVSGSTVRRITVGGALACTSPICSVNARRPVADRVEGCSQTTVSICVPGGNRRGHGKRAGPVRAVRPGAADQIVHALNVGAGDDGCDCDLGARPGRAGDLQRCNDRSNRVDGRKTERDGTGAQRVSGSIGHTPCSLLLCRWCSLAGRQAARTRVPCSLRRRPTERPRREHPQHPEP